MKKKRFSVTVLAFTVAVLVISCQKETVKTDAPQPLVSDNTSPAARKINVVTPPYDLNVILRGACQEKSEATEDDDESGDCPFGHLKFRQDPDPAKIIDLDIKLYHLLPFHEYRLQRAVDPINVVDGNCTSTTWLTLGKGLTPQSIFTDKKGNGSQALWRDVTTIPAGSSFDIHFQVVDAATNTVVLSSDCFQYQVRG